MSTFEEKVNTLTDTMTQDADGTWKVPADSEASEEVQYAATLEKRRRDTQASHSRSEQALTIAKAENEKLTQGWAKDVTAKLTNTQAAELATLKEEDPEAWRQKIGEYEKANSAEFEETRATISSQAKEESEVQYRDRLIKEFDEQNPDIDLNDDVIQNDLPPRYLKALKAGEIDFGEFLAQAKTYLTKGKVIKTEASVDDVSLSKASGSSTPSSLAVESDIKTSYKNEAY